MLAPRAAALDDASSDMRDDDKIGNGYDNAINPGVLATNARITNNVGSGSLVKSRCVLTAGHVALRSSGADDLPMAVFASPGATQNAFTTANSKRTGVSRISALIHFTNNGTIDKDLALLWLDPTAPRPQAATAPQIPNNHPTITIDYSGIAYAADKKLEGLGYSPDCKAAVPGSSGIQRYGYFNAFGGLFPTPAAPLADVFNANRNTTVRTYGRTRTDGKVFAVCGGDSGGPFLDEGTQKLVAVISGIDATDPNEFRGTETRPYQPWLVERLKNFCEPNFAVSVQPDSMFHVVDVTGDAFATVTTGQIIDCSGSAGDVCSFGLGSYEVSNPPDRLIGTGTVVLTGHNKPGTPYGMCFKGWRAGPPGSGCPCTEYDPNSPTGYTVSQTCTIPLIASGNANANELQTVTDSTWIPYQAFSGNLCEPVYYPQYPGITCPF
jgi:hypothetical protein